MTNLKKMSVWVLMASLFLTPAFVFADRGRGGGDGDRGRSGQSQSAQIAQDNSGPGSSNSGPGSVNRDRDDDDDDDDDDNGIFRLISSLSSGPGNGNRDNDDDDDDIRFLSNSGPGSVNSDDDDDNDDDRRNGNGGSNNSGSGIVQHIASGRGGDQERIRIRANGRIEIRGAMITAISGSTFQVTVAGNSFTVNAGSARLQDRDDFPLSFSSFAVGHQVRVEGVLTSTSGITATRVVNRSLEINDDICFDEDGFFDDDDDDCVIVNPDVTAPILSGIAAVPGTTSATITWTTNEPSTSRVFFSTASPLNISANTTLSVSSGALVTSHTLTITGLVPSTTYHYAVRSTDATGNTATSGQFSFTTQPVVAGNAPVISNVFTAPAVNTATISWTTDVPASATVFVGTTNPLDLNAASTRAFTRPTLGNDHSIIIPGLLPNTTYRFILRSTDANGRTATSNQFSFTTQPAPTADTTAPVVSGVTAAIVAPNTATVTWLTNELATSKLFFGTTTPLVLTAPTTMSVSNSALVTSHSISVSGLTASTTYQFIIQSADASGNTFTTDQLQLVNP